MSAFSCLILDTIEAFRNRWADKPGMEKVLLPRPQIELLDTYTDFVHEELREMSDSMVMPDRQMEIEFGDGLCDAFVYLATMTARSGYQYIFPYLYREVARSNATKGQGDQLFSESGRMIKGEGYSRPNLKKYWSNVISIDRSKAPAEVLAFVEQYFLNTSSNLPDHLDIQADRVFLVLAAKFPTIDLEPFTTFYETSETN